MSKARIVPIGPSEWRVLYRGVPVARHRAGPMGVRMTTWGEGARGRTGRRMAERAMRAYMAGEFDLP